MKEDKIAKLKQLAREATTGGITGAINNSKRKENTNDLKNSVVKSLKEIKKKLP